ncbi:MAG TPA: hypothetical protein VN639_15320 [Azonexus sp.]|nr:hypothetical protein [Azonexus sp.]
MTSYADFKAAIVHGAKVDSRQYAKNDSCIASERQFVAMIFTLFTNTKFMKKILLLLAVAGVSMIVTGCVTNPSQGGIVQGGGILSTDGDATPINYPPLKIVVPGDSGIVRPAGKSVVGDLVIANYSTTFISNAHYGRVFIDKKLPDSFIVHSRVDNGTAGSGVKYKVGYKMTSGADGGYVVDFNPESRSEYQQGLIGKFPVPPFNESSLRGYLKSFTLRYKFEIDAQYGSDAIMANFLRMAVVKNQATGYADPVTGKIYKQYFQVNYSGATANYTVQVFPYRNGSKAVINMELPVVETSPSTVDFGQIISDLRKQLTTIVQS